MLTVQAVSEKIRIDKRSGRLEVRRKCELKGDKTTADKRTKEPIGGKKGR